MRARQSERVKIKTRTRVAPGQKLVEEGVVVRQGLASGGGLGRRLARGSKVRELGRGLSSMVLDVLRNGSCII